MRHVILFQCNCIFIDVTEDGDGPGPVRYTDDTAMTRSVAKSLIEKKDVDTRDLAKR